MSQSNTKEANDIPTLEQPLAMCINNAPEVLGMPLQTSTPLLNDIHLRREVDPSGIDAHEGGAKLDAGKNRMGLVLSGFHRALTHVSKVGTKGAAKYSDKGFLQVEGGQDRYTDAMLRHWFKECTGEEYDMVDENGNQGTEELHAACVAWNALARLEFILRDKENNKVI